MRCTDCGAELQEGAAFCATCGRPQPGTAALTKRPEPAPQRETCEVVGQKVQQGFYGNRYRFMAEAFGPRGRYVAASSAKHFSLMDGAMIRKEDATDLEDPATRGGKALEALDDLIETLVAEGWEPIEERGPYWYSFRFRRAERNANAPLSRRKSGRVAFVLWLLVGLVGGHRYYLGRSWTGVLQTLTIGGVGIWWLIDLLLLPGMVRQANGTA